MVDSHAKILVIPSDLNAAWNAQQTVMEEVKARGYSENAVFAIRLALDEALNNAISHGNQRDKSKKVTIEYQVGEASVSVTVTDEGPGFNPVEVPDPTLDEFLERPHGRGIMLMRAYMSDVRFSPSGKSVTLIKNRNCCLPVAKKSG